jgi:hypothetical protein
VALKVGGERGWMRGGNRKERMDEGRGGEEEWNDERKKKTGRDSKGLGKKRKKGGRR